LSKEKVQKDKQRSAKYTYKSKGRVTRIRLSSVSGVIKQYIVLAWHTIVKHDIHV